MKERDKRWNKKSGKGRKFEKNNNRKVGKRGEKWDKKDNIKGTD